MIQTMRFDPVNYDNISGSGVCEIEFITISSCLPVYDSEKQYTLAQGLNGWSYHSYDDQTTYHEMVCTDTRLEAVQHSSVYMMPKLRHRRSRLPLHEYGVVQLTAVTM